MSNPLKNGTKLLNGKYTVLRHIATGGFGCVYKAIDNKNTIYAIKECFDVSRVKRASDGLNVIHHIKYHNNSKNEHEHQRKMARQEAKDFGPGGLRHPGLVEIVHCFDENNTTYLVMPFIDGIQLSEVPVDKFKDVKWALKKIKELALVLDCLHKRNLIHRDIKPDNIILTQINGTESLKLLDTGATRDFKSSRVHTSIVTDMGAPEITHGIEAKQFGKPGPESDCFSLAGVAYFLLTGSRPMDWSNRIYTKKFKLDKPPSLSDKVWCVLSKSLSLYVGDRHKKAIDLYNDLVSSIYRSLGEEPPGEEPPGEEPPGEDPSGEDPSGEDPPVKNNTIQLNSLLLFLSILIYSLIFYSINLFLDDVGWTSILVFIFLIFNVVLMLIYGLSNLNKFIILFVPILNIIYLIMEDK